MIPPIKANGSVSIWEANVAHVAADGAEVVVIATTPTSTAPTNEVRFFSLNRRQEKRAMTPPDRPRIPVEINLKYNKSPTESVKL